MKTFVTATVAMIALSGAASAQTATTTQANVLAIVLAIASRFC